MAAALELHENLINMFCYNDLRMLKEHLVLQWNQVHAWEALIRLFVNQPSINAELLLHDYVFKTPYAVLYCWLKVTHSQVFIKTLELFMGPWSLLRQPLMLLKHNSAI